MNFLIVVDMQNDFISGSLGSAHAAAIVPNVVKKVSSFDGTVIYTRDTHGADYMHTQEGEKLPVVHCTKDTPGCVDLPRLLSSDGEEVSRIELCGLCTDICVISNAMIVKAAFPEAQVTVDSSCCAGVTMESHQTALDAMKAVQIEIL